MSWGRYTSDPALREFIAMERGGARVLVRSGYEEHLGVLGLEGAPASAETVRGGRQAHPVVELPGGDRVVVRGYRRGGLIRHLNRDRYLLGHRAFAELRVTERARTAGVRVPETVAAVERSAAIGYTASLATRWLRSARDLAGWLLDARAPERGPALLEAGRQIGRMHDAGIAHADLNLRNLLVVPADGVEVVYLLDFDRAGLFGISVPAGRRRRDLLRLARSARKLAAPIDAAGWEALRQGYGPRWPLEARFD